MATLSVTLGETIGKVARRVAELLSREERRGLAFHGIEDCTLTFDGVPLLEERCVLMFNGVALQEERRVDAALLARIAAGASLQLVRQKKSPEIAVSAVLRSPLRMSDGTAGMPFSL